MSPPLVWRSFCNFVFRNRISTQDLGFMKILVTGATGQLGLSLKRVLESEIPGKTYYFDRNNLDITDAAGVEQTLKKGGYTHY